MCEVDSQRCGAHSATIVKLNFIWLMRRTKLTVPLQSGDGINEWRHEIL